MNDTPAILTDTTLCTGCEKCVDACRTENSLGKDQRWRHRGPVDGLSATRYCAVLRRPHHRYIRQQCRHCLDPACASACLVGALQKSPEGPVIYDPDKCIGCRYCMLACPFGIPRYDWDQPVPYIRKCNLCYDRLKEGKIPACVEACPEKATIYGTRRQLLAEAHRRLRAQPDKYVQRVYGETEVGGTSVLYISDIPLGFLGWKDELGQRPLPDRTRVALEEVPWTIPTVGCLMGGIYWIIERRRKLAALGSDVASETAATGREAAVGSGAGRGETVSKEARAE